MKLCVVCHKNKGEVPDRYHPGTHQKVCKSCHAERLAQDLRQALIASRRTEGK